MAKIIAPRMCHEDWGGFVECEPAILLCDCGQEVDLYDPLDNTCGTCGRNYNMSGQLVIHSSLAEENYDEERG